MKQFISNILNFLYWKIIIPFLRCKIILFLTNRVYFFEMITPLLIRLSSYSTLRRISPLLLHFQDSYILMKSDSDIKLQNAKYKLLGFLFPFNFAPQLYWGGGFFNLLGGSIVRYLGFNVRYLIRTLKNRSKYYYKLLKRDGVLVVDSILSDEQIKDVNLFYDKYISDTKVYFDDFSELLLQNTLGSVNNNQDYHSIVNFLKTNTKIFDIASELIGYRKEKLVNPYISILHFKSFEEIKDQIDGQNTPHIDVFYPSYKFFIYLNEVNELNGAFCYLKGSHSFSISNLVKYYKNCLYHYFMKDKSGLVKPTNVIENNTNINWFSANGSPGDAVVFNVQGIHKRGEFEKSLFRERKVLLIDFRQSEGLIKPLLLNV